ncbi:BlaI/MecI/CopY family transcriptional regulator [Listeria newyorkensis]|uniref:BlaI/MecI/CopY family transcriptional regulator n=1 Tax=Listeria newyorkensis TaxID=1497681 RepID=A0ABX4XL82_9LIST|nr:MULTISPECIES: BlaI/MecI/CopY family transcriptional regulator [Listeria]KGL38126.1 beta-lactamase repressor [Listeriaceae bacterium FSL A5-0209]KGL39322.1 beta-lactamase repressor [Listeria newyorkensis]KMT61010.1 penicillinase repressor [Listeria newyorkensis]PNP92001.1 BlaI/MecI/CopY family transcriptional regulator [Listeria newyorkensis]RQW66092.1 BlaI/MecI/CopY family transcriptional regulator [Listeria sp. SHR_NRA_18]
MGHLPKISEAELEVIQVIWQESPLTAGEIIQALEKEHEWSPKTIRTLLNRLVQKEAISSHQEKGKLHTYTALVSQEDYMQSETKSLLNRFYGAAFKPLLVNFIKEEKLSAEDIDELKQLLDDKTESNPRKDN